MYSIPEFAFHPTERKGIIPISNFRGSVVTFVDIPSDADMPSLDSGWVRLDLEHKVFLCLEDGDFIFSPIFRPEIYRASGADIAFGYSRRQHNPASENTNPYFTIRLKDWKVKETEFTPEAVLFSEGSISPGADTGVRVVDIVFGMHLLNCEGDVSSPWKLTIPERPPLALSLALPDESWRGVEKNALEIKAFDPAYKRIFAVFRGTLYLVQY